MSDVADTSKQSYRKLDKVKEMSQCDRIHEALRKSDKALTVNELNKTALADLDIPNGRVSARINKLKDRGRVVESDKREDIFTGRKVKTWTDLVDDSSSTSEHSGSSVDCEMNESGNGQQSGSGNGGEPSKKSEFVSMSEVDSLEDSEDLDGLFKNDKQSNDGLEPGDVIYG